MGTRSPASHVALVAVKGSLVMSNLTIVRLSLGALALSALATPVLAQQPQAPPPITMKQLKPDVWAGLGGAGGNSTIIIGKTGVIVVDAKQTEAGAKDLLAEIAKITPKPVTTRPGSMPRTSWERRSATRSAIGSPSGAGGEPAVPAVGSTGTTAGGAPPCEPA